MERKTLRQILPTTDFENNSELNSQPKDERRRKRERASEWRTAEKKEKEEGADRWPWATDRLLTDKRTTVGFLYHHRLSSSHRGPANAAASKEILLEAA